MPGLPVRRGFEEDVVGAALPTSGYLTMLGNVRRREDCVTEVADDVTVVVDG